MRSWLRRALPILLATALLAVPAAASARPGADQARHSLRAPLTGENFYFLMADRFENGTTGNDLGGLPADRLVSGFDPTAKGFYHGGDLAGIRSAWPTSTAWGRPRSGSPRASRTRRSSSRTARRPATTATGSPTSPRSTRTSAPTPSWRR